MMSYPCLEHILYGSLVGHTIDTLGHELEIIEHKLVVVTFLCRYATHAQVVVLVRIDMYRTEHHADGVGLRSKDHAGRAALIVAVATCCTTVVAFVFQNFLVG